MADSPPALLSPEQAAMICGGVGINAASARPGALPSMVRATGCRLSADRRVVTLLVASTPGAALLDDVRRAGRIAVVFSLPSTHRTLQLKGADAHIVPVEADDVAAVTRYVDAFVAELVPFGYPEPLIRTFLACDVEDLAAVRFTVTDAYLQTPGPHAGEPLAEGG